MDNASKALIMAGAILIAVALVSLGVYLYQSAAGKVNDGTRQVDASQMLMLNSEIEKFEGKIKGSELESYLNHGLKEYIPDDRTNPFIQTAGMGYLFSGKTKTIKKIFLESASLDMDKEYLVVMPSFLAEGGDGFKELEVVAEISADTIRNVMIEALRKREPVPFQNRIKKMFD